MGVGVFNPLGFKYAVWAFDQTKQFPFFLLRIRRDIMFFTISNSINSYIKNNECAIFHRPCCEQNTACVLMILYMLPH